MTHLEMYNPLKLYESKCSFVLVAGQLAHHLVHSHSSTMADESAFEAMYGDSMLLVFDCEFDGPSVRTHNMFAFGGVAISVSTKRLHGGIFRMVKERNENRDPKTMEFWNAPEQADMYKKLHEKPMYMAEAMNDVKNWIDSLKEMFPKHNFMFASDCIPADMKWMDTELCEHVGPYVLGHKGFDIYTYLSAALKVPRHKVWGAIEPLIDQGVICSKADGVVHDHNPYNDAMYEAVMAVDAIRLVHGMPWTPLKRDPFEPVAGSSGLYFASK